MDNILVTGASTGLGLETALYLASRGFRVYAGVFGPDAVEVAEAEAKGRGVSLNAIDLDVTEPSSVASAVESIVGESGPIFGLVNNAGIGLRGCFEDLAEEEIRRVYEVNLFGTMAITRAVLPTMRGAGKGRVVTLSSVGGRISSFGLSAYCATKFATEGWAEALRLELAMVGLHSILIEPGIIMTERWTVNRGTAARALDPESPYSEYFRRHEALSDEVANGSKTRPVDVAKVIERALTDRAPKSRYVVGRPARMAILMRRLLPDAMFDRIYFGGLLRKISGPVHPAPPALAGARSGT